MSLSIIKNLMNKLELIKSMIETYIDKQDMLVSTQRFLVEVLETIDVVEEVKPKKERKKKVPVVNEVIPVLDHIQISCDASIKNNPGGPASVGVVIRIPGKDVIKFSKIVPANTNNEAEYDAVYSGLEHIAHLHNGINKEIVVYSDSQLVVNQLTGKFKISEENKSLARRASTIHELARELPVPVRIEWLPRNSTPDLAEANYLAQDALGVPRH